MSTGASWGNHIVTRHPGEKYGTLDYGGPDQFHVVFTDLPDGTAWADLVVYYGGKTRWVSISPSPAYGQHCSGETRLAAAKQLRVWWEMEFKKTLNQAMLIAENYMVQVINDKIKELESEGAE